MTPSLAINLIGDYTESNSFSSKSSLLSFELSSTINLSNLNLNVGVKYLNEEAESRFGWLLGLNYNLGTKFNITLDMDNSLLERFIDEKGEVRDNFFERYSGTLNYKF